MRINRFRNKYFFLSNFYDFPVEYKCVTYANAESAFQAQKILDNERREKLFTGLQPKQAKALGRQVKLRKDWEEIKDQEMYNVVYAKFSKDIVMMKWLMETGNAYLEEGNFHGDDYWGTVNGKGQNKLGHILMRVRKELRPIYEGYRKKTNF